MDMALRFFATVDGEVVQFVRVDNRNQSAKHDDCWGWHQATRRWVKIERVVDYRAFASKHVCDDRCINATGKIMRCECSCGGKNHGKGAFNCTAEAA
jgi:hypothetical protein